LRYITAQEGVVIPLGRQGENEVTTIQFDVSSLKESMQSRDNEVRK